MGGGAEKIHQSVLLQEVIDVLEPKPGDVIFDGTVGEGGHLLEICKKVKGEASIIALDLDSQTLEIAKEQLQDRCSKASFQNRSYEDVDDALEEVGLDKIDKAILDLGMSSRSIEISGRGFSFKRNEPLLMTYKDDVSDELTAKDIVNLWSKEQIETVLKGYGGERNARRIAENIVDRRNEEEIETTFDLLDIIKEAIPKKGRFNKKNPATKTFQALRIAVNDEIGTLERGIDNIFNKLDSGGRLAIISFHSLEDRTVKNKFKEIVSQGQGKLINKKIIEPGREEVKKNRRARSAKLRGIIKI